MIEEQVEPFEKSENYESDQLRQVNDSNKVSIHMLHQYALEEVFIRLPILEVIYMQQVCRRWRIIINECWYKRKKLDFERSTWGTRRFSITLYHVEIVLEKYIGKYLTEIDMSGPMLHIRVKKYVINKLAELCTEKKLEKCKLIDMYLDDSSINPLQTICSKFKQFLFCPTRYNNWYENVENVLCTILQQTKRLEYFGIDLSSISGKCLSALPNETMHTLKICALKRNNIYLFEALKQFRNLKHLVLFCGMTSFRIFDTVAEYCKNLEILEITNIALETTSNDTLFLLDFDTLRVLNLGPHLIRISDNILVNLAKRVQQIVDLHLDCSFLTDNGIAAIATLPKLKHLTLTRGNYITDAGLSHIHGLKIFYCDRCDAITNVGIITLISSSPELRNLNFQCCKNITANIRPLIQGVFPNRHIDLIYMPCVMYDTLENISLLIQKANERFASFFCGPMRNDYY